ncbi:hypothetical protein ACIF8T_37145 [Streptomyces sp. NPDC085946]|uniref:hypothetical protein n=1 Tax=Streptomyces sp. NPDC085946 TaxID=3365744 RepID=UPI0037D417ED
MNTIEPPSDAPWDFALSPDGHKVTTLGEHNAAATVWNAGDGRRLRRIGAPEDGKESGPAGSVSAVPADGDVLLLDDGTLLPGGSWRRPGIRVIGAVST